MVAVRDHVGVPGTENLAVSVAIAVSLEIVVHVVNGVSHPRAVANAVGTGVAAVNGARSTPSAQDAGEAVRAVALRTGRTAFANVLPDGLRVFVGVLPTRIIVQPGKSAELP